MELRGTFAWADSASVLLTLNSEVADLELRHRIARLKLKDP